MAGRKPIEARPVEGPRARERRRAREPRAAAGSCHELGSAPCKPGCQPESQDSAAEARDSGSNALLSLSSERPARSKRAHGRASEDARRASGRAGENWTVVARACASTATGGASVNDRTAHVSHARSVRAIAVRREHMVRTVLREARKAQVG
jgi:hypothetical protein